MKVIHRKLEKFGWEGVWGWSTNMGQITSVSYLEIDVDIPKRKNRINDRVYVLIEGEVEFMVSGEKYRLSEKESISIPKNTEYEYKPKVKIKIIELNMPPFNESGEVIIKR
jgi:mannose-6-phosphate isomerase-like protein (cupin superfamily)